MTLPEDAAARAEVDRLAARLPAAAGRTYADRLAHARSIARGEDATAPKTPRLTAPSSEPRTRHAEADRLIALYRKSRT